MAPVGRWQQKRDLSWYAKSGDSADKAKQEREEEIRRIKEAEQDAMALALGLPVAPRVSNNANLTPLGGGEVRKAVQEATEGDGEGDVGRGGIGFGSFGGVAGNDAEDEILAPIGMDSGTRLLRQEKDGRDRGHRTRRDRSRDHDHRRNREHRDRDRGGRHRHDRDVDREHRHRHHREFRENREHRRHRSRSRSVSRSPRPEHRDRRLEAGRHRDAGRLERHRSGSPRRDRDRGDYEDSRDTHHRRPRR